MRKLNLKWLIGLVISPVIFGVGIYFLHEFQISRNAQVFVREAKRAQAANRPELALAHLRRYVKLAPNDDEGSILFGMQLADLRRLQGAFLILEKVIRRQPDRSEVRRKLVELGIRLGRYTDAQEHLQDYLLKDSPKESELLEQLATCQSQRGQFKEAEASLLASIENSPERIQSYIKLAYIQSDKLERTADANKLIELMVDRNSENYLAYVYRGQWVMQRIRDMKASLKARRGSKFQDPQTMLLSADEDAKQALKLAPDDVEVLVLASRISAQLKRYDEALSIARHGIELYPTDSRFYTLAADIETVAGRSKEAMDLLRRGSIAVTQDRESNDLKWSLANLFVDSDQLAEAERIISELRASKMPEAVLSYLDGKIQFHRSEWLSAIQKFEAIRPSIRDMSNLVKQVDYLLALAYRETSAPEKQLICLRRTVADDPEWVAARLALAEALVSSNMLQEAREEFKHVSAMPSAPASAPFGLARALLLVNLRKPVSQQNWTEFDDVLNGIEQSKTISQPNRVAIFRMERLLAEEKRAEAEALISAARENARDQFDLWAAHIAVAQLGRDWDKVDSLLSDAEKQFGDTLNLRLVKGRAIAQRLGSEGTDQLLKLSEPDSSWNDAQRSQLEGNYASLFFSINNYDQAIRLATMASQADPKNLRIRLLLLDIVLRAKKNDLMKSVLEEIRVLTAEGAVWHYGEAIRLILAGQEINDPKSSSAALGHLEKARAAQPSWGRPVLLAAEIRERNGETHTAAELYLEAIRLGEVSPLVASRALVLLFKEKRFDEADKVLRRIRETQTLLTDDLARAEIDVSLQLGRKGQALKSAEELISKSPQAQDPIWLGRVYLALEKYDDAADQLESATKARPNDAFAWISRVKAASLSKRPEVAENVIIEAKSSIEGKRAMLVVGQCYEMISKFEEARASYQEAVNQSPEDFTTNRIWIEFLLRTNAISDAEVALRQVINQLAGKTDADRENQAWALRRLALILVNRDSREAIAEASAIVERNLSDETQKSDEDLRIKSLILSRSNSRNQRHQAIAILEKLIANEAQSPMANDDRYRLARLYMINDDRVKARAELKKLLAASKDNPDPRYLGSFAQLCLQSNETTEAELYVNAIQKLAPNELSTVDLKSEMLFKKSKYSEVIELLKTVGTSGYSPQPTKESLLSTKLWAARRLEEFGRVLSNSRKIDLANLFLTESEAFYTQFVQARPEEGLVMAEFLAKTPQIDKAMDLIVEHAATVSPWRLGSLAVSIMKNVKVTEKQLERLQQIIQFNFDTHENWTTLHLISGDLLAWRGIAAEAARVYREVLQRDPKNIVAMNNLAYLSSVSGADVADSLQLVQKAIELGGPLDALLDTRGLVHLGAGHPENAIVDFEKALAETETAERRFHHALASARLKQFKIAKESLDKADKSGLRENEVHPFERPMLLQLRAQIQENPTK